MGSGARVVATGAVVRVTPERWLEIKALFAEAMELPVADRLAFVERACEGDPEMCEEVSSLLAAAEGTHSLPALRSAVAVAAAQAFGATNVIDPDAGLQSVLATALGQQYEIVRPLGRGGMGVVYLARERALERFVAIKVLRSDLAESQDSRERFRREARIAAQLSHPSILPLHTFGEVGGLWYFVMGYVRGVTLADRLRIEGRLPSAESQRILIELADALECAHKGGVIHRDIKPANILLDEESGRAMLADFGISKVQGSEESLTATGAVIGTPSYMSPEQALGSRDVDERSDIYSLGAVGYAMLAGKAPFADVTTVRRFAQEPAPLKTVAASVPEDLAAVVMRSLARLPDMRWGTAKAMRDALARAGGDASLPESLRELPTFGPYALLWAGIWTALAARPFRPFGDRALLLLIALVVPVGLMLHVKNISGDALRPTELARVAFWPPEWWGMWWPRALRRPKDLWARLPWPARGIRIALSAFIVALPMMILTRQWVEAIAGAPPPGVGQGWFVTTEVALVVGGALVTAAVLAWSLNKGLTLSESLLLSLGSTSPSPGWNSPAVARLLASPVDGVRAPEREIPGDYRRAIAEIVALLPSTSGDFAVKTRRASDDLFDAIERCDAELMVLNHKASGAEIDRLAAQLGAWEGEPVKSPDHEELTELVRRQLELVRRMRVGCELMSQRRARLFGLMRGLWTQLHAARNDIADGAIPEAGVRALCAEIEETLAEHDITSARAKPKPKT